MKSIIKPSQKEMYSEIATVKAELHELVQTFGIIHELTVAKSQELDTLVNAYMIEQHKNLKHVI